VSTRGRRDPTESDVTVVLTVLSLLLPVGAFLASRPGGATRGARLRGTLCFMAAAVNWVAAVFSDTVGPSRMIQVGVGVLLVISGAVAIRKGRNSV